MLSRISSAVAVPETSWHDARRGTRFTLTWLTLVHLLLAALADDLVSQRRFALKLDDLWRAREEAEK
jgi:hypothetical protein